MPQNAIYSKQYYVQCFSFMGIANLVQKLIESFITFQIETFLLMNQGHAFINSHLVLVADRNIPGVDFLVSAMVNYIKSTVHLSQHYVFDHISSLRQIHECPCSKLIRKSPSYLWIINEIVINRLVQICRPRACWAWTIRKK